MLDTQIRMQINTSDVEVDLNENHKPNNVNSCSNKEAKPFIWTKLFTIERNTAAETSHIRDTDSQINAYTRWLA